MNDLPREPNKSSVGEALPEDGPSFVKRLMPSAIVAMGGTELVAYLQLEGPKKVLPQQRTTIIDSMLARKDALALSPQGQDKLRRAMLRIASNVHAKDPAWGSLAMVRGTVTLSLWQTAMELAATMGGQLLCGLEKGIACKHEHQGFAAKWKHFIGVLSRLDSELADPLADLYRYAEPTILLRHRLIHGPATGQDGVHLERTTPSDLNRPLSSLRDGMIQAVLMTVFQDTNPIMTMHTAHFEVLGLSQEILEEALPSAKLEAS